MEVSPAVLPAAWGDGSISISLSNPLPSKPACAAAAICVCLRGCLELFGVLHSAVNGLHSYSTSLTGSPLTVLYNIASHSPVHPFSRSRTHSHTDGGVSHAGRQATGRWGHPAQGLCPPEAHGPGLPLTRSQDGSLYIFNIALGHYWISCESNSQHVICASEGWKSVPKQAAQLYVGPLPTL